MPPLNSNAGIYGRGVGVGRVPGVEVISLERATGCHNSGGVQARQYAKGFGVIWA